MRRLVAAFVLILVSATAGGVPGWLVKVYYNQVSPKNFSEVTPGVLYRSGQMLPAHFEQIVRKHGIRTVVCLNPGEQPQEPILARKLGVTPVDFEMPGSGRGEPAQFYRFLELLGDPQRQPVLVHCAAGAYRTGVSVALYRMLYQGWTLEDATNEMSYCGCPIDTDQDLVEFVRTTFEGIPQALKQRAMLGALGKEFATADLSFKDRQTAD